MSIFCTRPAPVLVFGALIMVQVLFGVNYGVSKVLVENFPPLVWASAQAIIASAIMISLPGSAGRKHPQPTASSLLLWSATRFWGSS